MKLFVLAGGFGKRLRSVVSDVPKVLAPIGNIPFLYFQIQNWKSQGIRSFVFLLHYQANQIINFLEKEYEDGLLMDCDVKWIIEPVPMDTGGALSYAVEHLNEIGDFLVTNADTWIDGGIQSMIQAKIPTIAVVNLPNTSRYGSVRFDKDHCVTAFQEKNNNQSAGWIYAGLCKLNSSFFKPWNGQSFSLERLTFLVLIDAGKLNALKLQANFIDIGVPDDYYRFCCWIQENSEGNL
jgi:D-glycero-alpha-D-manno-heptose 1-phosphate guanylyltransferase